MAPYEISVGMDQVSNLGKSCAVFWNTLAVVAIGVSLLMIAINLSMVVYLDESGNYVLNIGTHDVH